MSTQPSPGRRRGSPSGGRVLGRQALWLTMIRGGGLVASFAFSVVLGRAAGTAGAGTYFVAFSVVSVAAVVARLGLDNAVLRLAGASAAEGDWASAWAVHRWAWRSAAGMSVVLSLGLVVGAPVLASALFDDENLVAVIRLVAVALPAMTLSTVTGRCLIATGRVVTGSLAEGGAVPFLQLAAFWLVAERHEELGAAAALGAAYAAVWLFAATMRRANEPDPDPARRIRWSPSDLRASAAPLFWVNLLQVGTSVIGTTALGALATAASAGRYAVADRTANTARVVLLSINTVVAPRFSGLYHTGRMRELSLLFRNVTLGLAGLAAVVTALFIVLAEPVLSLFGNGFTDGVGTLRILALAAGINMATGPVGLLLTMSGNERTVRTVSICSSAVHLVGAVALIPAFGAQGAATAKLAAKVVDNVTMMVIVRRRLGIRFGSFPTGTRE